MTTSQCRPSYQPLARSADAAVLTVVPGGAEGEAEAEGAAAAARGSLLGLVAPLRHSGL